MRLSEYGRFKTTEKAIPPCKNLRRSLCILCSNLLPERADSSSASLRLATKSRTATAQELRMFRRCCCCTPLLLLRSNVALQQRMIVAKLPLLRSNCAIQRHFYAIFVDRLKVCCIAEASHRGRWWPGDRV